MANCPTCQADVTGQTTYMAGHCLACRDASIAGKLDARKASPEEAYEIKVLKHKEWLDAREEAERRRHASRVPSTYELLRGIELFNLPTPDDRKH